LDRNPKWVNSGHKVTHKKVRRKGKVDSSIGKKKKQKKKTGTRKSKTKTQKLITIKRYKHTQWSKGGGRGVGFLQRKVETDTVENGAKWLTLHGQPPKKLGTRKNREESNKHTKRR